MKSVDNCKIEISTLLLNLYVIGFLSCKQNERFAENITRTIKEDSGRTFLLKSYVI